MERKVPHLILFLLAIPLMVTMVAGCAEKASEEAEQPAEAYEEQAPDYYLSARDFLLDQYAEDDGLGGYSYLLFTSRPTAETEPRYQRACEAFISSLNRSSDYPDSTAYQQIVTYWPLQREPLSASDLESCSWLVENYDYPKAEIILSNIRMNHVDGPILVAWETPFNPNAMDRDFLVLNLSNFADQDIDRAISLWKRQTIKGPQDWEEGFLYARTKEELRNFIQRYGDSIFSIVTGGG